MKVISKKVSIKPGCIRSVHVFPSGAARWVVKHGSKLICVSGSIKNSTFVPKEKYKHIVDDYIPVRINRKKNNNQINLHTPTRITNDCIYLGEKRRVTHYSGKSIGTISWMGKRMKVEVVNGIARSI